MSSKANVWAGPNPNGPGWRVKSEGAKKAAAITETQKEAIDIAREIARNRGSESITQRPTGEIRERASHGNESKKPDTDGRKR